MRDIDQCAGVLQHGLRGALPKLLFFCIGQLRNALGILVGVEHDGIRDIRCVVADNRNPLIDIEESNCLVFTDKWEVASRASIQVDPPDRVV